MNQDKADVLMAIITFQTSTGFTPFSAATIAGALSWSEQDAQSVLDDLLNEEYIMEGVDPGTYDQVDAPRFRSLCEINRWLNDRINAL